MSKNPLFFSVVSQYVLWDELPRHTDITVPVVPHIPNPYTKECMNYFTYTSHYQQVNHFVLYIFGQILDLGNGKPKTFSKCSNCSFMKRPTIEKKFMDLSDIAL